MPQPYLPLSTHSQKKIDNDDKEYDFSNGKRESGMAKELFMAVYHDRTPFDE
jgi:hypothetical protein